MTISLTMAFTDLGDTIIGGEKSKNVNCVVEVKNPVGIPIFRSGETTIESITCESEETFSCFLPFNVFSVTDSAEIVFTSEGKSQKKKITIFEGTTRKTSLSLCVNEETSTGNIKLVSEGLLVDSQGVNF